LDIIKVIKYYFGNYHLFLKKTLKLVMYMYHFGNYQHL